ncbi:MULTISPECIES: tetratricopeptide repeat protein [unclassified Halomonas]|uniref:tetratricopeptide repeat protein n=1 Tax=unclassified Halomonas TaxID=2609666 RepID=UPI0006DB6F71|nr:MULTISPECIES: tetratricopeptide repeat protein [unclassified Halomonas]KPQ23678.1 MAG: Tetratricopeptide repeat [Halomonas sp. HL-93]SBR47581.1 Tetratricopeptide repeat-containing protein [Halomonas sp. HL-93]SNY99284.1 Tetratricopeptide repeat-containing protein [Halomonas sp. hl-4]
MPPRLLLFPLAAITLFVSGCQLSPNAHDERLPFTDDPMRNAPPISQGLDAAGLSTLLQAEFAGQRGDFKRASQGYLEAAERFGAEELAERATFAARFSDDDSLIEEAAQGWKALNPQAETPNRLLAALSLQQGNWLESLERRLALTAANQDGELTGFAETAIAEQGPLDSLLNRLVEHLNQTPPSDPVQQADALLAAALWEAALGRTEQARGYLDQASGLTERPTLLLVEGQLAFETDNPARARQAAQQGLQDNPDDVRFLLLLAQAEIRLDNLDAAQQQTDALLDRHSGSDALRVALAQLYLDEGYAAPAQRLLKPLVGQDNTPNLAYYLLGLIAQSEDDTENALLYYRQVDGGEEFLPARATAAQMLIDDDRLIDARAFLRVERMRHEDYFSDLVKLEVQLLDELGRTADAEALLARELTRTPDDTELLYHRAMRAWEMGDVEQMEQDLRHVISIEPDNAVALNALGYTLADLDLPDRLEEARELIERAYKLDADNPAVLDSLGWVHYRLGDPQEALTWLERAYSRMPDQEIAAHLAEVLHALGRSDEARQIINDVQQRTANHPTIDALIQRYPELDPADSL